MSNLKLDSVSNDIVLDQGQLVLISGADELIQRVKTHLQTFEGEWFLDSSIGVPWFERVFTKAPDLGVLNAVFRAAIVGVPGIRKLTSLTFDFNRGARTLTINFTAESDAGALSGSLTPGA